MDNPWGTVSFGSIYGPAAGQAVAERASMAPKGLARNKPQMPTFGLGLPALIALGIMAWYVIRTSE